MESNDDRDKAVAYAQEVYAGCATVGFASTRSRWLKALLDRVAREGVSEARQDELLSLAQQVQIEATRWAATRLTE